MGERYLFGGLLALLGLAIIKADPAMVAFGIIFLAIASFLIGCASGRR